MPWVYAPHSGGTKIPSNFHEELIKKSETFAASYAWYPDIQLKLRFKGQFCYVDTVSKKGGHIFPLCRLRYFQRGWSLALFTYSNERYEPCIFPGGKWEGTFEAALKICEPFVME
jgi:hypothetical protein